MGGWSGVSGCTATAVGNMVGSGFGCIVIRQSSLLAHSWVIICPLLLSSVPAAFLSSLPAIILLICPLTSSVPVVVSVCESGDEAGMVVGAYLRCCWEWVVVAAGGGSHSARCWERGGEGGKKDKPHMDSSD